MERIQLDLAALAATAGGKLLYAAVLLVVGLYLIKWLTRMTEKTHFLKRAEPTARLFVMSLVRILLYVLLSVSVIAVLGVPMASIVAVLASACVTVGLALQGALSNLAGGIMIVMFKPFAVGNYIEAAGQSGTVTEVSLFYTHLRTFDNKKVVIPNGTLMNANVVNYSTEETRRVDLAFCVAYGTNLEQALDALVRTAQAHELVLDTPAPEAVVSAYEDSAIKLSLRVWTKNADYWKVYFALNKQMDSVFAQNDIQVPFPQMDVHIKND